MTDTQTPIPPLTEEYRKAHKNYALFSGLLIAYELIGIKIPEGPIGDFKIEILSPDAVPYVLLVLVVYFAYRLTMEWTQCDVEKRKTGTARLDFVVAHSIAGIAIGIYVYQVFTKTQIFSDISWIAIVIVATAAISLFGTLLYYERKFGSYAGASAHMVTQGILTILTLLSGNIRKKRKPKPPKHSS